MLRARALLNLGLLALVLALGALIWQWPQPALDASRYPVSTLAPETVSEIRVARPGLPAIGLVKGGDGAWRSVEPLPARADAGKAARILELLSARSSQSLPKHDLERFGLAPPALTVAIDGRIFSFGMLNPVTSQQYLLSGDTVFLIDPRYGAAMPLTVADVLNRAPLSPQDAPRGFQLPGFSVTQNAGKWLSEPPASDLSQDDYNRWVDGWRFALATLSEPAPERAASLGSISVQLADGRQLRFEIQQREPELVLLRVDEGIRYRFPASVAERMLAPPGA